MPTAVAPKTTKKKRTETFIDILTADHARVQAMFKEFEALESKKQKQKLAHGILTELKIHAQVEEEIVYPALRQVVEEALMNEAVEEHHLAKGLIYELENYGAEDSHYDAKVTVLGEVTALHIKEEEGEMFKKAKKLKKADVEDVTNRLISRKKELQHQFSVK